MKRYWLFTYNTYYPEGGMLDFEKSLSFLEDCHSLGQESNRDNYQIFDSQNKTVVFNSGCFYGEETHKQDLSDNFNTEIV